VAKIVIGGLIYFTLVNLIKDRKTFERVLTGWVVLSIIIAALALYYVETQGIAASAEKVIAEGELPKLGKDVRVTMFFRQPNGLAFLLSFSAVFAVIRYYFSRSWFARVAYVGAITLMMAVLAATFSRKSWIGVGLAVGLLGLKYPKIIVMIVITLVVAAAVLVFSDTANYTEALYNRIMSFFIDPEVSISERVVAWGIGVELFNAQPVWGNGAGSFWILAARRGSPLLQPHNFYLYVLSELGLVGMTLFLIVAAHVGLSLARFAFATRAVYPNFVSIALLGCLFSLLFQAGFKSLGLSDPVFWGYFALTSSFLRVYGDQVPASQEGTTDGPASLVRAT
jgi:O-antigen ligase